MIQAATGHSKHRNGEKAVEAACEMAMGKTAFSSVHAAIVFASSFYRNHYPAMLQKIKSVTGAKTVVGSSAGGILTEEAELEGQPGVAVMLLWSSEVETSGFIVTDLQENNFTAGEKAGQFLRGFDPSLAFVLADPFSFHSSPFFDGLETVSGYVPLVGGMAAESSGEDKTYQLYDERVHFDAVSGIAFRGKLRPEIGITRSCRPFGEPLRITRAEGNMIYEMDGRPAYDILLESIAHIEFENPDEIFQNVFLGVPTKSFQTDFTNDYLIQHIMGVNVQKGMVTCVSPVNEGEFVTLAVRDRNLAREDMRLMLTDLKRRVENETPSLGFYFNCCARGQALYGEPNTDIRLIKEFFPNLPVLGFFSYGEIAPLDHVNHLHQHSGVLALLV